MGAERTRDFQISRDDGPGEAEDRALADRIAAGDEPAFETFLQRYGRRILSFGLRMCGHRQDAEDMVQEVFVSALKGLPRFRWEVSVLTWLFRIAAHRCQRMRRLRAGQPARTQPLDELLPHEGGFEDDALSRLSRREEQAVVAREILALPKDLRLVVVLRDVQGLRTTEVSRILSVSPLAVKSRLHRARTLLKRRVGEKLR